MSTENDMAETEYAEPATAVAEESVDPDEARVAELEAKLKAAHEELRMAKQPKVDTDAINLQLLERLNRELDRLPERVLATLQEATASRPAPKVALPADAAPAEPAAASAARRPWGHAFIDRTHKGK